MTKKRSANELPDFEKSLAELEKIVERMEAGNQTLEASLNDFERGMLLTEQCRANLTSVEQKVEKLVQKHGGKVDFEAFDADD